MSQTELHCPEDYSTLAAIEYHGVELDLCQECNGVWLDSGEIDHIMKLRRSSPALEIVGELGTHPDATDWIFDGAVEAGAAVLEFLADALSGL